VERLRVFRRTPDHDLPRQEPPRDLARHGARLRVRLLPGDHDLARRSEGEVERPEKLRVAVGDLAAVPEGLEDAAALCSSAESPVMRPRRNRTSAATEFPDGAAPS
jgi:hypothetical protein